MKSCALFPLMWANADDQGRLCGEPDEVKYTCCPNIDHITKADIPELLTELEQNGLIMRYETPKSAAIQLLDWWQVQKPQWAYPSEYPPPEGWKDRLRYHPRPDQIITENWVPPSQWDRELPSELRSASSQSAEAVTPQGRLPSALPRKQQSSSEQEKPRSVLPSNAGQKRERTKEKKLETEKEYEKETPKRIPKVGSALPSAVSNETAGGPGKKRQKAKQVEAGIFLDSVEKAISTKLVERPKLMNRIRPLLVKFPEATPEKLFQCFRWLKENDSFCRSRDSPTVIMMLPSKYPEWAAGKLPTIGGKGEQHGRTGEHKQHTESHGEPYEWEETPDEPNDTS